MDKEITLDLTIKSEGSPQLLSVYRFWRANPSKGLTRLEALHLFSIANLPDIIYQLRKKFGICIETVRRKDVRGRQYVRYFPDDARLRAGRDERVSA